MVDKIAEFFAFIIGLAAVAILYIFLIVAAWLPFIVTVLVIRWALG